MGGKSHIVLPPRGLSRMEAARYVGVSPNTLDKLIREGLMPGPKRVGSRVLWDRHQLDASFEDLPGDEPTGQDESDQNEWDTV
jgi:excisionase family DNA binding protein